VAVASLLALAACSGSTPSPSPRPLPSAASAPAAAPSPTPTATFPGTSWARAERGDWTALDADLAANGSTCVAVVQDGRLVHDAYWNGGAPRAPHRVYSIAKSLTSLLVGTAAGEGSLDLDAPAAEQIAAWRGTAAEDVTIRSLLSMTSGRRWSDAADRQMIRAVRDQTSFATELPQDGGPGERWVYDNAAVQTLEAVLAGVLDGDVVAAAQRSLLAPLGMRDTIWGRDAAGRALTYSGMQSTCLDLARVGHLMLNRGAWRGEQIVPAEYVTEATRPSSALNAAYGLLWWTNAEGRVVEVLRQAGFATDKAPYDGRVAPHVPADAFWAFGYGNQYVAVVPSEGLVAVRLGARPATPDRVSFDGFTSGVLSALDE
jgi:CubicO group peptidase (beta-lactamase class C family)